MSSLRPLSSGRRASAAPTSRAPAPLPSSRPAYLGLARKLKKEGPALFSSARPSISKAASPTRRAPKNSAISPSVGMALLLRVELVEHVGGDFHAAVHQGALLEDVIVLLAVGHLVHHFADLVQNPLG